MAPDPFEEFTERIPLVGILGMRLVEASPGRTRIAMEPRADMLQVQDVVHGGVLATLADTTATWAVRKDLPAERSFTSIEFKLNFLAPARVDGGEIVAQARVEKMGRRVAVVDTQVTQGATAVARGLFTYLLFEGAD